MTSQDNSPSSSPSSASLLGVATMETVIRATPGEGDHDDGKDGAGEGGNLGIEGPSNTSFSGFPEPPISSNSDNVENSPIRVIVNSTSELVVPKDAIATTIVAHVEEGPTTVLVMPATEIDKNTATIIGLR